MPKESEKYDLKKERFIPMFDYFYCQVSHLNCG